MKKMVLVAVVALAMGSAAFAQGQGGGRCAGKPGCDGGCPNAGGGFGGSAAPCPGGRGPGGRFDPASVTTTSGTVEAVTTGANGRGHATFVQLRTSPTETVEVHLGPAWFLDQQKLAFSKGDSLEVTGSKVAGRNGEVLVAQHVRRGEQALTLRDANGVPVWAGSRRP